MRARAGKYVEPWDTWRFTLIGRLNRSSYKWNVLGSIRHNLYLERPLPYKDAAAAHQAGIQAIFTRLERDSRQLCGDRIAAIVPMSE
jgi:hypothetical protein